jgi:hypothetical protein
VRTGRGRREPPTSPPGASASEQHAGRGAVPVSAVAAGCQQRRRCGHGRRARQMVSMDGRTIPPRSGPAARPGMLMLSWPVIRSCCCGCAQPGSSAGRRAGLRAVFALVVRRDPERRPARALGQALALTSRHSSPSRAGQRARRGGGPAGRGWPIPPRSVPDWIAGVRGPGLCPVLRHCAFGGPASTCAAVLLGSPSCCPNRGLGQPRWAEPMARSGS